MRSRKFSAQSRTILFPPRQLLQRLWTIREESDDDNEEVDKEEGAPEVKNSGDEELVIGGESSRGTKGKAKADKDIVSPHSIDGFWVQISEVYPDPVTAADKASSVLSILGSESSLRDCENQLMELFEYQTSTSSLNSSKTEMSLCGVPN